MAVLATVRPDGRPHQVPITFAIDGDVLYTAVDHKPKSTRALQRLANIEHDPRVSVLMQGYDDDWSSLWWCRLDGAAAIHDGDRLDAARSHLAAKYEQYERTPPEGPAILVDIDHATGWRIEP